MNIFNLIQTIKSFFNLVILKCQPIIDVWYLDCIIYLIYNFISNRCLYLTFVQTDLGVRGARWNSWILWAVHHCRLHHAILHRVQVSSPIHLGGKPHPAGKVGQVYRQIPLQDRDRPSRREGSIFQDGRDQGISC